MAGGPWNNTRGRSLCLQVGVVVGGALEQHTGPQSLFVVVAGGPWNNARGRSLCFQVGVVVGGGPWNNTRGRSFCLQVGVVVGGWALEQHTGPQSLFSGEGCCGGGLGTTHGAAVFVCRSSAK